MNTVKKLKKRHFLTLIEALVAFALVGLIVGECFFILTKQIKSASYCKKMISGYIDRHSALQELENLFIRGYVVEKEWLKSEGLEVVLFSDLGNRLDPGQSFVQKGTLLLKNRELIYQLPHQNLIIFTDIDEVFFEFYSQNYKWQKRWDSSHNGLPEMMHLKIRGPWGHLDKKILLPYNLKVIAKPCNSSPSFSL